MKKRVFEVVVILLAIVVLILLFSYGSLIIERGVYTGKVITGFAVYGESCVADSSCRANTCTGNNCADSCGNSYTGTKDCSEIKKQCSDGIDNDGDNKIDSEDWGCYFHVNPDDPSSDYMYDSEHNSEEDTELSPKDNLVIPEEQPQKTEEKNNSLIAILLGALAGLSVASGVIFFIWKRRKKKGKRGKVKTKKNKKVRKRKKK